MAILNIPSEQRQIQDADAIQTYLADIGVGYEQWEPSQPLDESASSEEILAAYSTDIERMKAAGGYVTADVIDIKPDTPNLDALLDKFNKEHWHDEDEVRFTLAGHGQFYLHPVNGPIAGVEVGPGDLLMVPRGIHHWFDLLADRRIRAIRLFQTTAGWTPHYTQSGAEAELAQLLASVAKI
ncbi:MAG: acireductone dioxygenase [Leptolyngbyaceae cyanobacterium MO_188.B28]|nr:acireductone dioxygenase [Leptolyngbyaceae cyanobacterium MO_188.B28]